MRGNGTATSPTMNEEIIADGNTAQDAHLKCRSIPGHSRGDMTGQQREWATLGPQCNEVGVRYWTDIAIETDQATRRRANTCPTVEAPAGLFSLKARESELCDTTRATARVRPSAVDKVDS